MMRQIIAILIVFSGFLIIFNHAILAQESSSSAVSKPQLTFPIAELGNCSSLALCKSYCDDSKNAEACISFAKTKGFYKAPTAEPVSPTDPRVADILKRAKELLGCDSLDACKKACSLPENRMKCSTLTSPQDHPKEASPGGSLSTLDKMAMCSDFCVVHPNLCSKGNPEPPRQDQGSSSAFTPIKGPGGCTSVASCTSYCREHQAECANFDTSKLVNRPPLTASSSAVKGISIGPNWITSLIGKLLGF